jgi:hypothetical protein
VEAPSDISSNLVLKGVWSKTSSSFANLIYLGCEKLNRVVINYGYLGFRL